MLNNFLRKLTLFDTIEIVWNMNHFPDLILNRIDNSRMAVPDSGNRPTRKKIEILFPFDIPNLKALCLDNTHRNPRVSRKHILIILFLNFFGFHNFLVDRHLTPVTGFSFIHYVLLIFTYFPLSLWGRGRGRGWNFPPPPPLSPPS